MVAMGPTEYAVCGMVPTEYAVYQSMGTHMCTWLSLIVIHEQSRRALPAGQVHCMTKYNLPAIYVTTYFPLL